MAHASSKTLIRDFTTGPVLPTLVTFALPLFLSNLLQAVYNMVDMMVVGRVVGQAGLSGISVGGDVLSLLTFLSMGFANASQVILSQYIGAGKRERVSRFIGTMASSLLLCAAAMSVLCLLLRGQILGLLNTPAESWDQAMAYATTCIFGLVFIYGYNVVSAVLRGMGDSKRPFLFIALAAVLNLLLDLLFVAGLGLEAFGAALATVIAQGVSFVTALVYLYRKREQVGFDFSPGSFRIDRNELAILVKLGVPMAIRSGAILFSKLFVNAWVNSYGVTVSAVSGIGSKLDTISGLMGTAINTAGSSIVGQNIGAGKYDRVRRVLGSAFLLSGICFSLMAAVVGFFPGTVFGFFTEEADVLLVCMEYVPVALASIAACSVRAPMNAFTTGCGNYKFNFAVAIMDGIVARVGLSLLFGKALGLGYFGFWMGNAVSGCVPFLLGAVYYLSGRWRKPSQLIADS
ncbi:MAG: MATE family efflux transporter [Oscillospiraceae bacterium]